MAKAPKKAKSAKGSGDGSGDESKSTFRRRFMLWIALPTTALIFFSTAVVLVAGMIPTAVAYFIDKSEGKYATRTVGYTNLSAALYIIMDMWASGDKTWDRAMAILGDPFNWLVMFGAAGVGWGIYFLLPPLVFSYLHAYALIRNKSIKEQQKSLIKEWGDVVAESAPMVSAELMRYDPDVALDDGSPPPLTEELAAKIAVTKKAVAKKERLKKAKEKESAD